MLDQIAESARVMNVTTAIVAELARQDVIKEMADLGFDPAAMARAVIKAADGGEVIPFPPPLAP